MKGLLRLFLFVVLLAALAACGGSEPAAEEDQAPAAEVTAVEPTVAPAEEPAAAATEAPASEVPPTEQPTAEPTREPTAEPANEPANEPAPAGEGWGESGTTAQSACDHPYFPLREGYTYTMKSDVSDDEDSLVTWEVTSVTGDLDQATAEMQMTSGDSNLAFNWECSRDGGLVSYEFGSMATGSLDPTMKVEVTAGDGQFLPPVDEIAAGYSWPASMASTITVEDPNSGTALEGQMQMEQTSHIANADAYEWDGSTLPAFLMQQDQDVTMSMSMPGIEDPFESTLQMSSEVQFVRGIGMVRQTSFTDFGDFTSEMVEVYVP